MPMLSKVKAQQDRHTRTDRCDLAHYHASSVGGNKLAALQENETWPGLNTAQCTPRAVNKITV